VDQRQVELIIVTSTVTNKLPFILRKLSDKIS